MIDELASSDFTRSLTIRPYGDGAREWRKAGWKGTLPIGRGPAQKSPPPRGYTGWAGVDPSGADVEAWIETHGALNLGVHVPHGYYFLDRDAAPAWDELEARCGPLPATWSNTSRGKDSLRRILIFRAELPEGRVWKDHPIDGIDSVHVGHRYMVAWPSVHPSGEQYLSYDPSGEPWEGPIPIDEVATLPPAWVEACSKEGAVLAAGAGTTDQEALDVVSLFRKDAACPRVTSWLSTELDRLNTAAANSIHSPGPLYAVVAYGLEGHAGVPAALGAHHDAFIAVKEQYRGMDNGVAGAEWWRMVRGAVDKKLAACEGEIKAQCGCNSPDVGDVEVAAVEGAQPDEVDALCAEMLSLTEIAERPAPRYLIKGLLNLNSLAWIIGAAGCKKSFVALDMCMHVARGQGWQELKVTQAKVIIIAAEGAGGMGRRVKAWQAKYGDLPEGVHVLPRPVQASNLGRWAVLVRACVKVLDGSPGAIVVDTQARVTVGMEENSNTEMMLFVDRLEELRTATGACIIPIHHTGRNGGDARGASALDGAQDTELTVVKKNALVGELRSTKQKDMDELPPIGLRFEIVTVGVDEDGDNVTSLVVLPADAWADSQEQEPVEETGAPLSEPQAWSTEHVPAYAMIQRRILQAMRQHGQGVGRTEAQYRAAVKERWYPGQKRLQEKDWAEAWTSVLGVRITVDGLDDVPLVEKENGRFRLVESARG